MEVRGHRGVVVFDGTTVTLTRRGGDVVHFPAECVHAAWVDLAGPGLWSLSFTVVGGGAITTHRMVFTWRCVDQLRVLRDQVVTVHLYRRPAAAGWSRTTTITAATVAAGE
jgi:hypothetical protein